MFVTISINIIIVLVAIFVPALLKATKLNKSGQYFAKNVNESTKGYLSIVAPDVSRKRSSHSKDIDELFSSVGVDDFSIDNFFDSLR